jgi:capsule polysaccharide export protein KpsE/RkpR
MTNSELIRATTSPTMTGLRLIRLRWRLIALCGVIGIVGGIAFYVFMPKSFEAELMIVPKSSPMDMIGGHSLLGNLPFDIGGAASAFGPSDSDRIAAVLESRSVTDAIIAKFDLIKRYRAGKIERTRKALWSRCETTVEKKPNVVRLLCEDEEPAVVRDMTNAFGDVADAVFRRMAAASAAEERAFLEKRVAEARRDMEASSVALRDFQEAHKIIDLPEQGKAVVSGLATLEGSLISKRIELSYASSFAAGDESSVAQLRKQIGILSGELHTLEAKRSDQARAAPRKSGSELFPPAMELPALGAELEKLLRQHKIHETVFLMLTERYEARKLDEARDLSTFVVVDEAALPTHRSKPTLRAVPAGFFAGLVFGVLIVVAPAWWRDLKRRAAREAQC